MKKKDNKILFIFIGVAVAIVVGAVLFVAIKNYLEKHRIDIEFTFAEEENITEVEVGSEEYTPPKMNVTINEQDYSEYIVIDDKDINLKEIGSYNIIYKVNYKNKTYEKLVPVEVVDTTKPEIILKGKNTVLLIGETYEEPGYEVKDNSNEKLDDKVVVKNEIDNTKAGTYKVTYTVSDASGNEAEVAREVTVKKPNVVVATPPKETKVEVPQVVVTAYTNTLKKNKFTSGSINLEGYIENPLEENKMRFVNDDNQYELDLKVENNAYTISINPENIPNGTYKVYINEEKLLNKIAVVERLARAKVGSKLVTFSYSSDDEVTVSIADHSYQYDILINPGHGGSDTGAVNEYITEKEMNLTVSMYEKCRYEAHGLRVYMTRTSDEYGDKFGPTSLIRLHRVAYEMGYYGAVSKIVYSNHHNSIGNDYFSGYEILLAGSLTSSQLQNELAIANKWNSIFDLTESHNRFYARDYDTEAIYSKLNGETYSFKDNYAVNRIPLNTANVKSVIFEGCYMSNKKEFNWYWNDANWYIVSEAKIEVYVKSLGLSYNPDNSSCM